MRKHVENGFNQSNGWGNWNKDESVNNSYKQNGYNDRKFSNNRNTNGFNSRPNQSNNNGVDNNWQNKKPDYNWSNDDNFEAPSDIKVVKDFLTRNKTHPKSLDEIEKFRQSSQITVDGHDLPPPMFSFDEYPWPEKIIDSFKRNQYVKPTPIQSQGWPIALSGRDLVGIAQTGSGKTLSFMLPAFIHIDGQPMERKRNDPIALVLAPTRELAQQIQEVVKQCNNYQRSVCIFGGQAKFTQRKQIQNVKPQIIIATPGRLIDFLDSNVISVSNISYLVLDEADRMLDMGFEPQIRKIIKRIPSNRQTLMWSATWPKEVKKLATEFLVDYAQINIGSLNLHANHNITQIVEVCLENEKKEKLIRLLQEVTNDKNKTIIFTETKRKVDVLTQVLRNEGWSAIGIHGDKSQGERDWTLREFKTGASAILVATDVAARGLDVDDIKYVINFDYPSCSEDYVHRIGRTGRRDNKGTAYTFFTRDNCRNARDLIGVLKEANQPVNPQLYSIAEEKGGKPDKYRRWGFVPREGGNGYGKRRADFNDGPPQKRFHKENGKDYKNGFKSSYSSPKNVHNTHCGRTPSSMSYPPQVASTSGYSYEMNRHN